MLDNVKRLKRQHKIFLFTVISGSLGSVVELIGFLYSFYIKREVENGILSLIVSIMLATMVISFIITSKLMKKQNLDNKKNDNSKIQ